MLIVRYWVSGIHTILSSQHFVCHTPSKSVPTRLAIDPRHERRLRVWGTAEWVVDGHGVQLSVIIVACYKLDSQGHQLRHILALFSL